MEQAEKLKSREIKRWGWLWRWWWKWWWRCDEGCDEDADECSMIDSERLGGFGNRLTNERTDIGNCRVSFASENVSVSLTLGMSYIVLWLDKIKSIS